MAFVALALIVVPALVLQPPDPGVVRGLLHALVGKRDAAMAAYEARLQVFTVGGVLAAIAAAVLALIGVVRHERRALAFAALGVAAVALVWQYVLLGVVAAVVIAILLTVLS